MAREPHAEVEYLILGIDAAWTRAQPSGVALVTIRPGDGPGLHHVGRSYREFTSAGQITLGEWLAAPVKGSVGMTEVLETAHRIAGRCPDIVVLDMPLARGQIVGRRPADRAISRQYGGKWASTHTPTASRPGDLSVELFAELSDSGYVWRSAADQAGVPDGSRYFIETYPHPVIIEMLDLGQRLPYKVTRRGKYWPRLHPDKRWQRIASELDRLRDALSIHVGGVRDRIPMAAALLRGAPRSKVAVLKGLEDALDAIVCAYVGCEFLAGRAVPFGDEKSAIWIQRGRRQTASVSR
jgi:predicted RNase H-like nuclease